MDTTLFRDELVGALMAADPTDRLWALALAPDTDELFPELADLGRLGTGHGLHKDVLDHTIRVTAKIPEAALTGAIRAGHPFGSGLR